MKRFGRTGKPVRLIGAGVRFAEDDTVKMHSSICGSGSTASGCRPEWPPASRQKAAAVLENRIPPCVKFRRMTSAQETKIRQTGCDVRFDNLTRQLYATDASIYQIEPLGVAFPKGAEQASAVIRAAADAGISVTPRGAGTSLVGNAIGEGLIVDFSRHNRQITDLDLEKRNVRVGAGVVLDQLNDFLQAPWILFRSGCSNEFTSHAWRNDREQFLRRAMPSLRHNRRSRDRLWKL